MNICDNEHDEVCYDTRWCPVCEKQAEIESLEREIENLRDEIKVLEESQ